LTRRPPEFLTRSDQIPEFDMFGRSTQAITQMGTGNEGSGGGGE
jgi:hypothetical protein